MSAFARTIYEAKYAWKNEDGEVTEDWPETAERVVFNVLGALGYAPGDEEFEETLRLITERKFIPGGRYLYASGRGLHQTQNCLLLRAKDSREGWADIMQKSAMALMTGAGIGIEYSELRPSGSPIKKTGGEASGPISLMKVVNEIGRNVMQGGSRRSAIWAGLNWKHGDIFEFIKLKDWSPEVRALKEKDFNFPATMDMTNISVLLDDEFFAAYEDETHPLYVHACEVYWTTVERMLKTGEPGFSIDTGHNAGETLRNAPVTGETHVWTIDGYQQVKDLAGQPAIIWTGHRWAPDVVFSKTQKDAPILKVKMTGGREIRCEPNHEFLVEQWIGRGKRRQLDGIRRVKAQDLKVGDQLHVSLLAQDKMPFDQNAYTLGYIYGDGSFHVSGGADLTLCTSESKKCLPALVGAHSVNENDGRGFTRLYFSVDEKWRGRSKDAYPKEAASESVAWNESFLAGLFDADGNWEPSQKRIRLASKSMAFLDGARRALESLGILAHVSKAGKSTYGQAQGYQLVVASDYMHLFSAIIPTQRVKIDLEGYSAYRKSYVKVVGVTEDGYEDVYCADVKAPEHSFMAEGVIISNCTEVTSADDSDICNLGSINLARIESIEEMEKAVRLGTLFLLAGTVYSHVPYEQVDDVRTKNRRLGLGIMGVHEWLLKRGKPYGPDAELDLWLREYQRSGTHAYSYAHEHSLSVPVKTRAIAPNGTIGIVAETTTGIEPIFCVAFKRRYKEAKANGEDVTRYQYVIDPTAQRLIEDGVDPSSIEDAYSLSYQVERRVAFQAWMQQFVDHGISSTINLPYPITHADDVAEFGEMLIEYLPRLRGITCYPDGARGGQPLTAVPYHVAASQVGVVFEETEERCVGGVCGS